MTGSSPLSVLVAALADGSIEVVDLTSPLSASTPVIQLPPEFGQTAPFALEEISRYDDRGPAWYWNNFTSGEHTGTHFDAPNHWVTGKDLADVASVPAGRLIAPAVVLDFTAEVEKNPDFLVEVDHLKAWEAENVPLPAGGWLFVRTGMGRAVALAGGVPQRRRDRAAHAGPVAGVRAVGRAGVARPRPRRRDRRDRRREGALVRPAVPVPLLPDGQ